MKPLPLQPGDTIGVVTPASPITPDHCQRMFSLIEGEGFKVKTYPGTFRPGAYLAGSDNERAEELTWAMEDPETKAVLCSRGGYGCSRLLPFLDLERLASSRKLLMGFSDITILHAVLNQRGLPTAHAPMAYTLQTERSESWSYKSFKNILANINPIIESAPKAKCLVSGKASGQVVGGCLILIADLLGTPEQLDLEGKIVVIEGVDDAPHRVDAMFTHLINSNSLPGASGIIVGEMTRTDQKDRWDIGIGGAPWREIIADRLAPLGIPTMFDFPFGHAANMLSVPLGIQAVMDADAGTITYTESLCE